MININEALKERQELANNLEIEVNVMNVYQASYEIDKEHKGSNKQYLSDGESYQRAMNDRYKFCLDTIDQVIESKYKNRKEFEKQ